MTSKQISGLIGIVVGGGWLLLNLRHVGSQGIVAIAFPAVILVLGIVYFIKGKQQDD